MLRWGLRRLTEADFAVCTEADSVAGGFRAVERLAPDLLVTDLTLGARSGAGIRRRPTRGLRLDGRALCYRVRPKVRPR